MSRDPLVLDKCKIKKKVPGYSKICHYKLKRIKEKKIGEYKKQGKSEWKSKTRRQ